MLVRGTSAHSKLTCHTTWVPAYSTDSSSSIYDNRRGRYAAALRRPTVVYIRLGQATRAHAPQVHDVGRRAVVGPLWGDAAHNVILGACVGPAHLALCTSETMERVHASVSDSPGRQATGCTGLYLVQCKGAMHQLPTAGWQTAFIHMQYSTYEAGSGRGMRCRPNWGRVVFAQVKP